MKSCYSIEYVGKEKSFLTAFLPEEAKPYRNGLIQFMEGRERLPFALVLKIGTIGKTGITYKDIAPNDTIEPENVLGNEMAWPLFSKKVVDIIKEELTGQEKMDWISVEINWTNGRILEYFVPRFHQKHSTLNLEKTKLIPGTNQILSPVYSKAAVENLSIFPQEQTGDLWKITSFMVVSEVLAQKLEFLNVSGIRFRKEKTE
jgi:hypothetical protein